MHTLEYSVPDVTCSVCTSTIDNTLDLARKENKLSPGIRAVNIDLSYEPPRAFVEVLDEMNTQAVKKELNEHLAGIGFEFTEVTPVKTEIRRHLLKGLLGLLTGALIMGLCISGWMPSLLMMYLFSYFGIALTLYLGKETYKEAFKKLKAKQLTMHTLFSISTLMAIGISVLHFIVPGIPFMIDTALLIFGFVHIGKMYEKSTKRSINRASSYRSLAKPKILVKQDDGSFHEKLTNEVKPGQIVRLLQGQVLALDSHFLPGESARKRTMINPYSGSNLPQTCKPETLVLAGSLVPQNVDFIDFRVSATEDDSYLAFLEKRSKAALTKNAPLVTTASKLLHYFVPTVLILAVVSAIVIGIAFTPLTAIQVAATILASACPCTLGLIIPLAIKVAFLQAATQNIHFANGDALQAADEVDTVVFDLNGTLTLGEIRVTSGVETLAATNLSPRMLDYLAAIEHLSEHPFAVAICHYIHDELRRPRRFCPSVVLKENYHSGLSALIGSQICIVGNKDLMKEKGFSEQDLESAAIPGHEAEHVVYLAYGGKIQGCILLSDPLREEAAEIICKLQEQGKHVHICTGAPQETAQKYAHKLERLGAHPIPSQNIATNRLPDSKEEGVKTKTDYIHRLKAAGHKVAMIGDGLNDSRAFESSHFSIAIESASGHKITQDKAGAVIRKRDNQLSLHSVLAAFLISKQTVSNIKQNLALSLSYNLLIALGIGVLLVGIGFVLNPAVGAALMFIQSAFILTNLHRLKHKKLSYVNDPVLNKTGKLSLETTTSQLKQILCSSKRNRKTQDDSCIDYGKRGKIPKFYKTSFLEKYPIKEEPIKFSCCTPS